MIFRGRFHVKLDSKSRLSLPSAYREVLNSNTSRRAPQNLIITNSQQQGRRCLDAYPESEWQNLEKKISKLPQLKAEVQAFQRFYLSGGHSVPIDSQWRVLLPPSLRQYASLQGPLVLVGFAQKFEIWSEDVWNSLFESLATDFDKTLAGVADLVGGSSDDE